MNRNEEVMAIWDMYATAALSGISANPEACTNGPKALAHWAATLADCMLTQRCKRFEELLEYKFPEGRDAQNEILKASAGND